MSGRPLSRSATKLLAIVVLLGQMGAAPPDCSCANARRSASKSTRGEATGRSHLCACKHSCHRTEGRSTCCCGTPGKPAGHMCACAERDPRAPFVPIDRVRTDEGAVGKLSLATPAAEVPFCAAACRTMHLPMIRAVPASCSAQALLCRWQT